MELSRAKAERDRMQVDGPRKAQPPKVSAVFNPWAAQRTDTTFYRARQIQDLATSRAKVIENQEFKFD